MKHDASEAIIRLQRQVMGKILTLAELGLPESQFKPFKKQVFELFHDWLKPETLKILNENRSGQGRANDDNFDGKEC